MSAVATHMADAGPFSEMAPAIVAMLRDEANLSTARHVLDDARHDCMARLEKLRDERPPFGILATKKQRDEYTAAVDAVERQLRGLDAMISRVNASRDRLQPGLRAAMVDYLNHADPMYHQGLKASRFHEHWRRAHAIVADRLKAFIRDTREARNAIASDVTLGRPRHSADAVWRLSNARAAAVELDREIDTLNEVTAGHQSFVAATPFSHVKLPLLEKWNCMQRIDTLTLRLGADALREADQLIAEFTELRQPSLASVMDIFESAAAEHAQLAEGRLRQCWSTLLAYAEAHLVTDAELEPTLLDIERRQAEQERARVSAQILRPFDGER